MTLESRYRAIQQRVAAMTDFSDQTLMPSRDLFEFQADPQVTDARPKAIPKRFEVWTNLVGLPLPADVTQALTAVWHQIISGLTPEIRYYAVQPATYHWELFIIKRPDEAVSDQQLHDSGDRVQQILAQHSPFSLTYRGFLITPDGTVLVKGYGDIDPLRAQLRQAISWASPKQSQLGHVSLGRILDPVGPEYFAELNQLVQRAWDDHYGTVVVDQVKWVHESQWYMEECDIVRTFSLRDSTP